MESLSKKLNLRTSEAALDKVIGMFVQKGWIEKVGKVGKVKKTLAFHAKVWYIKRVADIDMSDMRD